MLIAFCCSAFAWVPQQDTTRKKQDSTKKHDQKMKSKMKHKAKKDSLWKDTLKGKTRDTLAALRRPA